MQKFKVSKGYLVRINQGLHKLDGFTYPLYKRYLDKVDVEKIEKMLITTKKMFNEIAEIFNLNPETIKRINLGKHKFSLDSIQYPLRKTSIRITKEEKAFILQNKKTISVADIARALGRDPGTIRRHLN